MITDKGFYYFLGKPTFAILEVLENNSDEEFAVCNFFISSDETLLNKKNDDIRDLWVKKDSAAFSNSKKIDYSIVFQRIFLGENDLLKGDY